MSINFGTDGWRAILGQDFTEQNVSRVSLAIGKYIYNNFGSKKKILIGFDPRNMADIYAKKCAELLCDKGFEVELSSRIVPTPVLAYNAQFKNAGAIMFTASHNPPEYLGIKYIPDYAGPATKEITDEIINNLDKNYELNQSGSLKVVDFAEVYYEHIEKLTDFTKIKNIKTNIIYDGLYSASIGYFDILLKKHDIPFKSIHLIHDKNFGGGMPDPKPKYLSELINAVKNNKNSIGIANDGDADRFGVINEKGEYVSPNEIISILLKYLLEKGLQGSVVKTVGSSLLIDNVANALNINVIETAVGFKHVGEAMRKNKVIIGGEESGGLSILGHIPEKDGLLANLLVLEVMADTQKSLVELQEEIYKIGGKFYTDRIDLQLQDNNKKNIILDKFRMLKQLGEYGVSDIDLKDGVKLMFGNRTKILARPSGTEPLLRIYFESDNNNILEDIKMNVTKLLEGVN